MLIVFVIAAVGFSLNLLSYSKQPLLNNGTERILTVMPGEGLQSIARRLADSGLIQSPLKFSLLARIKGYDKKAKTGEYLFSGSMTPAEILEMLVDGKVILYKVTIPEGYSLRQIATVLAEAGLTTDENFIKAAENADQARREGIEAETFEGYLFPDTYYFSKGVEAESLVNAMVRRFQSVFGRELRERAERLGFSVHEIVTLASLIEKETGLAAERPLISSVFHNRLQKKMRLESDPTVIYGIEGFSGRITRKDLNAERPYNTYRIRGLPPGPIVSPGLRSLEAALFPADTDYLYFVSRNDKSHQFSKNYSDHHRAVQKYQLNRNTKRPSSTPHGKEKRGDRQALNK